MKTPRRRRETAPKPHAHRDAVTVSTLRRRRGAATHKSTSLTPRTTRRYQAAKENPAGPRAPLKVVYVVLESQYQSSMSAAVKAINENENSGVACECVGYLLEELRDEKNAAAFKKDVEEANVFIGSLIFVQELAEQGERGRGGRARPPGRRPHLPVHARGHAPQQGRRVYHGVAGPVEVRRQ